MECLLQSCGNVEPWGARVGISLLHHSIVPVSVLFLSQVHGGLRVDHGPQLFDVRAAHQWGTAGERWQDWPGISQKRVDE